MLRIILRQLEERRQKLEFRILTVFSFFFFLSSVFFLLASPTLATAGIYRTINFQGKVVNKVGGTNITNGSYSFVFKLYDAASAGTQLPSGTPWSETQSLTVTDGIFRATLGSSTVFPAGLDFNSDLLYLDITFNGETFGSRVRLTAVPYAFNAEKVSGLTVTNTTGTLTIPDATTVSFSGANNLTFTTTALTNATLPTGTITLADTASTQTFSGKSIGSTGLIFNGATTDIATVSNEDFTIAPNGTGKVEIVSSATASANVTMGGQLQVGRFGSDTTALGNGSIIYNTTTNKFRCFQAGAWADCIGTGAPGSSVWSDLTAPTAALSMNMYQTVDTSFATTFTYGNTTSTTNLFNLTDTASNTGTGYLANFSTATGSTLKPFRVAAAGVEALLVNASGFVGIGTTSPTHKLDVSSISSTADLVNFDWSPASPTVSTADLFSLNIGANGTIGTIFNVKDNGSSVLGISQSAITANLPANFTAAGDVGIAYNITFSNPTSSFITSAAPLYIVSGEAFNSSDLTLRTYNYGNVIVDSHLLLSNATANTGKALAILNQLENQDIFTASASGITKFTITNNGSASMSGTLTVGNGTTNAIQSPYGALTLNYKSGLNAWAAGLTVQDSTGNVGIGNAMPTSKLDVKFDTAPAVDVVSISNSGFGTVVNNVDGLSVVFVQGAGGSGETNAGINVAITGSNDANDTVSGVTVTSGAASAGTILGVNIAPSSVTGGTLIGEQIGNITGSGSATEYALSIGTGWDRGLTIGDTTNYVALGYGSGTNTGLRYAGTHRPTKSIVLHPEYSGAVLTTTYGAGTDTNVIGAMTSDIETSAASGLKQRSYYMWKRTQTTLHYYTVAVRVTLPKDFSGWAPTGAVTVDYLTNSSNAADNVFDVYIYEQNDLTTADATSTGNKTTANTSYETVSIDGSALNVWEQPGETAIIYLRMGSLSSNWTKISDITLNYLASF